MSDTLPEGWASQLLGKLATIITKGTTPTTAGFPYEDSGVPFVKVENIDDQGLNLGSINQFISVAANDALKRSQLNENDVLFSIAGTIGKTALVESIHVPANTNQAVAIIRGVTDFFTPKFLRYQLKATSIQIAKDNARGGGMNNVSLGDLKKTSVKLAPLPEQKAIAEKLDTLLAQVENTKARLEGIPVILKQFRQSVLAAAVSGELTEDYVDEWNKVSLGNLIQDGPQNGIYKPSKLYGEGTRIIRIDGFYDGKLMDWGAVKRVKVDNAECEKWGLKINDILVNRVNSMEYLGKCALIETLPEPAVFESNIMRISINTQIADAGYLTLFLRSQIGLERLRANAKQAVNQASINQGDVKACLIDMPKSVVEQQKIVRRVETLFTFADKIEQQVQTALENVNNLTQSILAQAFSGELTKEWREQNPDLVSGENSAEALLERIKTERAKLKPSKKPTRRKKVSPP